MASSETDDKSRKGYRPEWLALEDASGGRYHMAGDLTIDVPVYNQVFAGLAKAWPPLEEELDVSGETVSLPPHTVQVRIYKPKSDHPLPLMLFFPGGGYIAGNLDTEDSHCRIFAAKTPCVVVSVAYPLSPPALLDDIIDAGVKSTIWARENAPRFGADPNKTLLCGGSAGAMLAAQVAYRFTAHGNTTAISGCILLFAVAAHWEYKGKHADKYTAWAENGTASVPIINLSLAKYIWSFWKPDFNNPAHFVLLADDLSKFPPTYIVAAEKDCFRDDGIVLDIVLTEQGVKSKLDYYPGLPHYFHTFPQLEVAHEMMRNAVEGVRFVLGQGDGVKSA